MPENREETTVNERNLSDFADKLDGWAESLPEEERGLLTFLLARAEASNVSGNVGFTTELSPGRLASAILRPLVEQGVVTKTEQGGPQGIRCNWSTWTRGVEP